MQDQIFRLLAGRQLALFKSVTGDILKKAGCYQHAMADAEQRFPESLQIVAPYVVKTIISLVVGRRFPVWPAVIPHRFDHALAVFHYDQRRIPERKYPGVARVID